MSEYINPIQLVQIENIINGGDNKILLI